MKNRVTIDIQRCKGCKLCARFCPKKIIGLSDKANLRGYHPAAIEDLSSCTGCGICYLVCPDVAIEIR
ncbi:4Fe-4S binding protein [bacterium]|nr:4Fe-4S binding protein [bacterium]